MQNSTLSKEHTELNEPALNILEEGLLHKIMLVFQLPTRLPALLVVALALVLAALEAIREGVTVTALNRQSQMPDFLTLVNSTEMRHGRKSKYSDRFWNEFAELCEQDSRFSIMCVNADNHLAAAHVYICERESAQNWQIYFDKSFSSLKPNQAITAQAIAKFQAKGIKSLNLGATPPEATGVADYKKKWGGHEHTYPVFDFRSLLGRALP